MGRLESQANILGVGLLFSYTHFFRKGHFPLSYSSHLFRNLVSSIPILLLLLLTKSAIREISDIDDLWFGKNLKQTDTLF